MNQNYTSLAEAYYTAIAKKNIPEIEKFLHPDIQLITPLSKTTGKAGALGAIAQFTSFFRSLKIRSKFSSGNQAVIVYDVEFPSPIGVVPSVSLLTFKDDSIIQVELFFNAAPFKPTT